MKLPNVNIRNILTVSLFAMSSVSTAQGNLPNLKSDIIPP